MQLAFWLPLPIYPGCRNLRFDPCIPTRGTIDPGQPKRSIREIKHDGYRLIVQRDGGRRALMERATGTIGATAFR